MQGHFVVISSASNFISPTAEVCAFTYALYTDVACDTLKWSSYLMKILETKRLILREILNSDFDELYRMNSDPAIMKYVGDGSTRNHEQMRNELGMLISHYTRKPGLGIWA